MKKSVFANRTRKMTRRFFLSLAIIFMSLFSIFPFIWMVLVSLKDRVYTYDPSVWLFPPTLENYIKVFSDRHLERYLINSAIIAIISTIIAITIGSITAYGFARYKFKNRQNFTFFLLSIRMLPAIGTVIPIFIIASYFKVIDTYFILIITYLLFNVPFTVLMMQGFFEEIPYEVEEAAKVDGCSPFQALRRVILPLVMPGLIATSIFCIINAWNEFVYALFLTTFNTSTTPTIVQIFLSVNGIIWGEMSAVGTIATLPVLIFAMIVQKNMIRGLSFGAVKG